MLSKLSVGMVQPKFKRKAVKLCIDKTKDCNQLEMNDSEKLEEKQLNEGKGGGVWGLAWVLITNMFAMH